MVARSLHHHKRHSCHQKNTVGMTTNSSAKEKVVFVMGATGTGKSRLAIDLATRFAGEVINSDKMQVYKGLNIVTNKVTAEECGNIRHHLIGTIEPDQDFNASDFRTHVMELVDVVLSRGRLPIIAGGSNSFIEALVDGEDGTFRAMYECCFLWVEVALPVLDSFVSERVDDMVRVGMVEEVKEMFDPNVSDYSRGIRRSIGFPEMSRFLKMEITKAEAIKEIKENTCILARNQLGKIIRLFVNWRMDWRMRVDATEAFLERRNKNRLNDEWENKVARPSIDFVIDFLTGGKLNKPSSAKTAKSTGKKKNKSKNKNKNNTPCSDVSTSITTSSGITLVGAT
ncbi:tRNA dimethylallyltransferase [Zostera marina]|uniref:tRNA dimethylallyltransferase n=1 Tax=Zostera marina TaxID=29655 RepID=A0A0K9NKB1_ZOSMR|nr:tRNA dimethylallyltransferase [Zostera marina]